MAASKKANLGKTNRNKTSKANTGTNSGRTNTHKGNTDKSSLTNKNKTRANKTSTNKVQSEKNGTGETKRAEKKGGFQGGHLICHVKTRFPEKAKERPDLGGLSSGGKNRKRNRLYHRRTVREDPGD